MRISPTAIVLIAIFAVLLFGGKRLPDAARALGRSLRILKSETKALRQEFDDAAKPQVDTGRVVKTAPGESRGDRVA
ncbi:MULTISPECIES: Sec-independent protein translocase subunit TatA [Kitasatospora]|uniref:Sec-independent protein translocase protein TatA n=2 Tax=Kitasatospora TaxID=2063 RepID=A0ABT1IUA5_9ACTN|nr:Sec-independent protein translocase subunit TatA [Kitasatospora paracochleata]MCP2308722.1 sec-independent protein translocase protein TatA [Kitasatospora paracochleata]